MCLHDVDGRDSEKDESQNCEKISGFERQTSRDHVDRNKHGARSDFETFEKECECRNAFGNRQREHKRCVMPSLARSVCACGDRHAARRGDESDIAPTQAPQCPNRLHRFSSRACGKTKVARASGDMRRSGSYQRVRTDLSIKSRLSFENAAKSP